MSLMAIGTVYNNNIVVGIRLYDTVSREFKEVPLHNLKHLICKGVVIDNLGVRDGKLVGTNGSLDRYPKIVGEKLMGKSPLIVLNKVGDIGYDVVDWKGHVGRYRESDVVRYSEKNGIANGKIVEKDGTKFISSIVGEYRSVELPKTTDKVADNSGKVDGAAKGASVDPDRVKKAREMRERLFKDTEKSSVVVKKEVSTGNGRETTASGGNSITRDSSGQRFPVININKPDIDGNQLVDESTGMTVEQKIARVSLVLKNIDRFLYSLFISVNRVPIMDARICPTLGVAIDT